MSRAEHRWCVYEDQTGVIRLVDPETQENAEQEARLAGEGHRAVPLHWGEQMRNAFAHGRISGWDEGYRAGKGDDVDYVGTFYNYEAENPYIGRDTP